MVLYYSTGAINLFINPKYLDCVMSIGLYAIDSEKTWDRV